MANAATHTASGIGLAVVEDLVAKEWNVAVFDFDETAGNALAKQLGERALFIGGNVIKYDELVAAFDRTFNHWGHIDLVFANAVCTPQFTSARADL
jgi:NAD(P)-dependent dehydrogenase (short-subunit alcohol dehydrogenase family)